MYRVYGDMLSGNCYKIKMLMEFLHIDHEWIHIDILSGKTKTPEFISMNRNTQIPVLQIEETDFLTESNAILNYLAEGTRYLPDSGLSRAKVLQWQFFEQYSHEPYIAVARYINKYLGLPQDKLQEYQSKQLGGHKALAVMEDQLSKSSYFVGHSLTIADISLYAYTHVSHEGGFDLSKYTHIQRWLKQVEEESNYVSMGHHYAYENP